MARWILLLAFIFVLEWYSFQAFRVFFKTKTSMISYWVATLLLLCLFVFLFSKFDRRVGQTRETLFTVGLFLLIVVPKLLISCTLIFEDIGRLFSAVYHKIVGSDSFTIPNRRKFISQIGLGLAAVPFLSLIYGMTKGKYQFKIFKYQLFFDDLPEAFDGFTLTQISDIHSGSFDNPEKITEAIKLINDHPTDLFLFTGDIVNTHAKEMHPWIDTFKSIRKYPFGKFSILGNHDYGEYVEWSSQKEKADNFAAIKHLHQEVGFKLLLNENVRIQKDGEEIVLVGVENWGVNFKQAGDLKKASAGTRPEEFKILMSHDPSHWEKEVKHDPNHYHLTLSGHTHGLQFGIEIPGWFKWSPVQYIYKQWAGLYEHKGRLINVNRGFGFHAYPGRVGIWPEITLIELKKTKKLS
jgi:predicted MPP superfamily phosphohydrolase